MWVDYDHSVLSCQDALLFGALLARQFPKQTRKTLRDWYEAEPAGYEQVQRVLKESGADPAEGPEQTVAEVIQNAKAMLESYEKAFGAFSRG